MAEQQTLAQARGSCRNVQLPHFCGQVTDIILPRERANGLRPQGFLVEQDPHWTLPTHFHQEHQFQLFVGGSARLGRRELPRLTVHYASPHSAYGPLCSGDAGVAYLTLRAISDQGAWVLPDKRENLLLGGSKQQIHAAPSQVLDATALRSLRSAELQTLIEPSANGPAAWLTRLPPAACMRLPSSPHDGAGRFHALTCGQVSSGQDVLEGLALIWSDPGVVLEVQALQDGAELVTMEFAPQAARSFVEDMKLPRAPY